MPWGSRGGAGTLPGPAGGVPCLGGTLARGGTLLGVPCWGGTLPGDTQVRYPPSQVRTGSTLAGGVPRSGTPPGRVPPQPGQDGGGTQLGQHREYFLHGGRYASCVHAGGLSCLFLKLAGDTGSVANKQIAKTNKFWTSNRATETLFKDEDDQLFLFCRDRSSS